MFLTGALHILFQLLPNSTIVPYIISTPCNKAIFPHRNTYQMKSINFRICLLTAIATIAKGDECIIPSKFSGNSPKSTIYVIMNLMTGKFFKRLMFGIERQAELVGSGVNIQFLSANSSDTKQAENILLAAKDEMTVGILTVDGSADTLCAAIDTVFNTTQISVVSFDFQGEACSEKQVLTSQENFEMAKLVLDNAVETIGQGVNVGYVNDLNFAPLRQRNDVWEAYKIANNWNQVFFVANASTGYATQADLQSAIVGSIEGTQNLSFIYAPWDYLSETAVSAVKETGIDTIDVYGSDINDEDITTMRNSTWKATAGGDPLYIGASLTRMVAKAVAKELGEEKVIIPSFLITQEFLLENNIKNMTELDAELPAMRMPDFVSSCWIESIGGGTTPTAAPDSPPAVPVSPSSGNIAKLSAAYFALGLFFYFLLA
jgi:ABC-type sugar transport system substrate-binding protein